MQGRNAMAQMPEALKLLPTNQVPLRAIDTIGLPALRALLSETAPTVNKISILSEPMDAKKLSSLVEDLSKLDHGLIMVMGKGGVGKSTVTANLAMALKNLGAKVGILDADISGPSIPVMFGAEDLQPLVEEINGKNRIQPIMQYGIKMISMGFLAPSDSPVPWRGPMMTQALRQFFGDTNWGELDYLLIDLPPGTSDIHLTLVQLIKLTGAVIVTTPQKVALSDATKGLQFFNQAGINVPLLGLVENMAYFTPAELPENKYYLFGKDGGKMLAEKYKVPFLGEVPLIQAIREAGDEGKPIASTDGLSANAFIQIATNLAQQIAISNAQSNA
jgi:ATP-binding protein involved in chromosome partitioning